MFLHGSLGSKVYKSTVIPKPEIVVRTPKQLEVEIWATSLNFLLVVFHNQQPLFYKIFPYIYSNKQLPLN